MTQSFTRSSQSHKPAFFSIQRLFSTVLPSVPDEAFKHPSPNFKVPHFQIMIGSLVINLLSLALPILTLQVYDRLLVSHNVGTLQVLATGVVIVICLEMALRLCRSYITIWAGATYEHVLSCNAIRHILATDLVALQCDGVGTHMQRMGAIGKMREFMSGSAIISLIDLPFIFVFLGLIAWLAGWLVVVPTILLCIFTILAVILGMNLKKALQNREKMDRKSLDFIIQSLEGIHSLKSLALESFFLRRYESVQKNTSSANLDLGRLNAQAVMLGMLFSQVMMVAVIAVGAPMALDGGITMGTLIACVLLAARVTQPVQRALGLWTRYQDFQLANADVSETFSLPRFDGVSPDTIKSQDGELEMKNVHFSYTHNDGPALEELKKTAEETPSYVQPVLFNGVDLHLRRGDSISISGARGSGKTTLLKMMAGLYKPDEGEILIDGTSATTYPARTLVQHVALLSMEGMIFRGTIWDNISAFGQYSAEQVYEMTKLLELDDPINRLPAGFDTRLEGGHSDPLPPGLRQRITIARVLAPKSRLILFDNADRALDKDGYNVVYRLLARLKKKATLVLVSDDRNISLLADKQYILADGKLVEKVNNDEVKNLMPYKELRL